MTPIFPRVDLPNSHRALFGAGRDDVDALPAVATTDGLVLTEWVLSDADRQTLAEGGTIRLWIWTYGQPLQPVAVEVATAPVPAPSSRPQAGAAPGNAPAPRAGQEKGSGSMHDAMTVLGTADPDGRSR